MWEGFSGRTISNAIDDPCSQTVQWGPNLFRVPPGSSGKKFVVELVHLFEAYTTEFALEAVAMKAAMILPALLLRKPHAKSKIWYHISCLQH